MCRFTIKQTHILFFSIMNPVWAFHHQFRWFILSSRSLKRSETSNFKASIRMMKFASTITLLISIFVSARAMLLILFFKWNLIQIHKMFWHTTDTHLISSQSIMIAYVLMLIFRHLAFIMIYGKNILGIILITLVGFTTILLKITFLPLPITSKIVWTFI